MNNQTGQALLLLIVVMTVALAIGLSIVQKSLVDVSTATKVEQSARAYSAAEAGIEKALRGDISLDFTGADPTARIISITGADQLIPAVASGRQQDALEYPPMAKEEVAQIWLANFESPNNPPDIYYKGSFLDVYWGNSSTDPAAIELTLVYYAPDATSTYTYQSYKSYIDNPSAERGSSGNGFDTSRATCTGFTLRNATYQCITRLDMSFIPQDGISRSILIRARMLYNASSQPFAVQAIGTCGQDCSLPPQSRSITSTGVSGEAARKVQVIQTYKVVPPYFDYAAFAAGTISK